MSTLPDSVPRVTENTCAILSAVFPLIALTVTFQRRDMHIKIRRFRWAQRLGLWSTFASLAGLIMAVIGVQTHGLNVGASCVMWGLCILAVAGLAFTFLGAIATFENEEDASREAGT
jgi:hypothetical protein